MLLPDDVNLFPLFQSLTLRFSLCPSKGYYSIIIHMFLDLNVNFMPFDVSDALDFVSFFAFKCNGTSVLAEIHRLIMSNLEYYRTVNNDCESMYEFLCTVNESFPGKKAVGSCSNPRYNYSGGSNKTEWCKMHFQLLEVCNATREVICLDKITEITLPSSI